MPRARLRTGIDPRIEAAVACATPADLSTDSLIAPLRFAPAIGPRRARPLSKARPDSAPTTGIACRVPRSFPARFSKFSRQAAAFILGRLNGRRLPSIAARDLGKRQPTRFGGGVDLDQIRRLRWGSSLLAARATKSEWPTNWLGRRYVAPTVQSGSRYRELDATRSKPPLPTSNWWSLPREARGKPGLPTRGRRTGRLRPCRVAPVTRAATSRLLSHTKLPRRNGSGSSLPDSGPRPSCWSRSGCLSP